jgi:cyanophycinase
MLWDSLAYQSLHQSFHLNRCCIGGTSAGAAVMSRHMIAQGPAVLRPSKDAVDTDIGLGLLSQAVVDQHFSERRRLPRLLSTLAMRPDLLGVGIDEDTALVIERGEGIEVIGKGSVTLVDPSQMQTNVDDLDALEPIEMLGVQLHMLPAGHRYSVKSVDRGVRSMRLRRAIERLVADLQSPAAELEKEQGNGSSPEASTVGGGQQSASEQMPRVIAASKGGNVLEK